MILAAHHPRRQDLITSSYQPPYPHFVVVPKQHQHLPPQQRQLQEQQQQQQYRLPHWSSVSSTSPRSDYNETTSTASNIYSFGADPALFDYQSQQQRHYNSTASQSLMQSDHSNNSWLSTGQLTPTSTTRARHHRESSLSSLGSAGPASPYTANTSNPQVAGDIYHDFHDFSQLSSKPLTPTHTPSQEQFLANFYSSNHIPFTMGHDGIPKQMGDATLMPAAEFNGQSSRQSDGSVASHDSPSTPPVYDTEERRKNNGETSSVDFWLNEYLPSSDYEAFRNAMPKLDRTMTDVYADELYNPSFQITSAPATSTTAVSAALSIQNDIFTQRLQAANSQHLSASNLQTPLTVPSRERSPFRQGSPLAPSISNFGPHSPNVRFGTATHMREQQKAEDDARVLQQQMERTSPEQSTPKTISPKDVDLIYHESEEDAKMPLFPSRQQQRSPRSYRQQPMIKQEALDVDDGASQQSYGSMATSRRESSSTYSTSSQIPTSQGNYSFVPPPVPASVRQIPQQYPFVAQSHRQPSNLSNVTEEFPASLTSMESSSSEYVPETLGAPKKPAGTLADTGTYTCTYHACTLRFETPSKLQRHKREGHRNSAAIPGIEEGGMTSAALRNTQNGPHKCERINPSTGKPCNTIFSRPYDLTRHEDTIHNARKQKVRCHLCTEEKTFSRNDALTRHFRVCHPEHLELTKSRRRAIRD